MISNYSFLNKAYFALLVSGLLIAVFSAIASVLLQSPQLFSFTALGIALMLAGIICKILVWYNVYSEIVTKESFKKATMSGSVFQKKKK
jgi:hypothetical protein